MYWGGWFGGCFVWGFLWHYLPTIVVFTTHNIFMSFDSGFGLHQLKSARAFHDVDDKNTTLYT